MIKKRKAKLSERGVYLQDKELRETNFEVGKHFKYLVDVVNRQIVITPTDEETNNTVSKRRLKDGLKPVLDIRNKEALAALQGSEYLQVEIYENEVRIKGYVAEKVRKGFISKIQNILDISDLLNVKQSFEVRCSKDELAAVVGNVHHDFSTIHSAISHEAFEHLHIPLQAISLFSGAGISDLGFLQEGFDVVFAIDKEEAAVETYRANIGDHIYHGDITEFDKEQFARIGAPIMFGGSPCQGFSNANRRDRFLDNPNNLLVRHYIESVQANPNCQIFVLENVPQLLSAGDGQFKREIEEELCDFEITSGILSAHHYGDPQKRSRAIMIGSKIGRIDLPEPMPEETWQTVGDALSGVTEDMLNAKDYSKPTAATVERMKHVGQGENWRSIPPELHTKSMQLDKAHSIMYRRLAEDEYAPAIVNIRKALITHPTEHRTLSIRECARLFSVHDDFHFKGCLDKMQQMIVNAIPVRMVRAIARKVKEAIFNNNAVANRQRFALV